MEQFEKALSAVNLKIIKFDLNRVKPVITLLGPMYVEKFRKLFQEKLAPRAAEYPQAYNTIISLDEFTTALERYARDKDILIEPGKQEEIKIHPDVANFRLNYDLTATRGSERKFFCTDSDEIISKTSGDSYLLLCDLQPNEAIDCARRVIPDYLPHGPRGVSEVMNNGKVENVFNIYTPPHWQKHKDHKDNWKKIPDTMPPLLEGLVNHLFPIQEERDYFYTWTYDSIFNRSFVFLILCGAPGAGKNRLKLVLRALHGHVNTVDGKKSTLVEKFNSQLAEATFAWFDELHYDAEMENTMKELQNDSIAIERKGVDATRGTRIHSSIVIANNKPRDNYIAPDSRKFVPLVITNKRLEESMKPESIDLLTKKVEDETSSTFDPMFLAQIVKALQKRGRGKKWPNLEYRGPMFWKLAHTSMTRWQKKAISTIIAPEVRSEKWGYDFKSGRFLWSDIDARMSKKNGDRSMQFPDYTTVRAFFDVFRDGTGKKAFTTEAVPKNILGDFYLKPLFKQLEIITEASISEQRGVAGAKARKGLADL